MNITIVGPRSVGKSTISKKLSDKLEYKYVESDDLMNKKMKEYGGLDKVIKSGKTEFLMKKGLEVIKKTLDNKDEIVFDLPGGSISSKKGTKMGICQKVIKVIKKKSFVIGLFPYDCDKKSIDLLYQRERKRDHFANMNYKKLNKKVKDDYIKLKPILKKVSDLVIKTGKKEPKIITNEIFQEIQELI